MTTSSTRIKLYWRTARCIMLSCTYTYALYDVIVPHVVHGGNGCGVYSRAAFISLSALEGAAFIRWRHLFKGGV